jgi:hypothetical protein
MSDEAMTRIGGSADSPASGEKAGERAPPLTVRLPAAEAVQRGDRLWLKAEMEAMHLFDIRGNAIAYRHANV